MGAVGFLRERKVLLVIDNFEQVPDAPHRRAASIDAGYLIVPAARCSVSTVNERLSASSRAPTRIHVGPASRKTTKRLPPGPGARGGLQPRKRCDLAEICRRWTACHCYRLAAARRS
jgi:hypothetical protein